MKQQSLRTIIWILLGFTMPCLLNAQKVTFKESRGISESLSKFKASHSSQSTVKGWRIQIISTDDRRKMESARGTFNALYPGIRSKWNHIVPYYQVRVGAYRTKTDLMPFLMELKTRFPTATPVVDDIEKKELI